MFLDQGDAHCCEASGKNSICQYGVYASGEKLKSLPLFQPSATRQPALQAAKCNFAELESVFDSCIFKIGVRNHSAQIFGSLVQRHPNGLISRAKTEPFLPILPRRD